MSVCATMATCLLRTLLPVVTRIKFHGKTTQNLQRLTCIHPEALSLFLPRFLRSMAGAPPGSGPQCKDLCYDDIIHLTRKNEIILIDVREPSEIKETGKLPGSIHIPLGEIKQALEVTPADEFEKKYGIAKPDMTANLVFSCRSGKRSRAAMETAMSMGFLNSRHYNGGYLDWEKHHPQSIAK